MSAQRERERERERARDTFDIYSDASCVGGILLRGAPLLLLLLLLLQLLPFEEMTTIRASLRHISVSDTQRRKKERRVDE